MKKNIIIGIAALIVLVGLGVGAYTSNASQGTPNYSVEEISELVTAQYPGTITEIELEKKGSDLVYEVEVDNGKVAYDIKLDANTGVIIRISEKMKTSIVSDTKKVEAEVDKQEEVTELSDKVVIEKDDDATDKKQEKKEEQGKKNDTKGKKDAKDSKSLTDLEQAMQVAQKEFPGMITTIELERDDGKHYYEIDIISDGKKVELDIEVGTGKILSKEIEDNDDKYRSLKGIIAMEKAIDIALKEFPGEMKEAELDEDDGRFVYEIEVKSGGKEAAFDIDAYTGEIISIEIDND